MAAIPADQQRHLTVGQLAAILAVTDQVARRWLRENRVPGAGRLPGGDWRIPPAAVPQLLGRSSRRGRPRKNPDPQLDAALVAP
jgi:excisionase family DNA binding protein